MVLSPAELYLLFQQNGLLASTGVGRPFVNALVTGRFPVREIEKFVAGERSAVDQLVGADGADAELNAIEDAAELASATIPQGLDADAALPVVQAKATLAALNRLVIATADAEAVEFLIASAVAKIWRHAFVGIEAQDPSGELEAVQQAEQHFSTAEANEYSAQAARRFLEQHRRARELRLPADYRFRPEPGAPVTEPNLMQRLFASRVLDLRRFGNWSGTGAGKTLAAILATRAADAGLTIVCCPNSVVKGWSDAIDGAFADGTVARKTWDPPRSGRHRYLVLNYEMFQQPETAARLATLLRGQRIDFVVIDEIHHTKQREVDDLSLRRRHIQALVSGAGERNPQLHVLAMSATPVINNLQEGRSMVELVTGLAHGDLETRPTVSNCMALHQKLVTTGMRWLPQYDLEYDPPDPKVLIDCGEYLAEIRALGRRGSPLALEQILTQARLPAIREQLRRWAADDPEGSPRTLLYTHYISGIDKTLRDALLADGWRVGFFTGDDKSGLDAFLRREVDVLVATSAISTGVDGLQSVCHRMVINALPWTHAEYEQLKGRLFRQGQTARNKKVQLMVPVTYATVNGERWSWCESKWQRLLFKKSIADAAVDGVVPEGQLRSPAQAYEDVIAWLERLDAGEVRAIEREVIRIALPEAAPAVPRTPRRYSDFSEMNRHWDTTASAKTHERLERDPQEWIEYHELYREARRSWTVVPYEEFIRWAKLRQGLVIADFGCGEAKVAAELTDRHTVYSLDHVAIGENVVACDMAHTPLDDESVDVGLFSLSLMGTNLADYLREANRVLKLDGTLHIYEATSRFRDRGAFVAGLSAFGFKVFAPEDLWKFTHIEAKKDHATKEGAVIEL